MAERSSSGEYFVQVGVTALRNPATGEFLPSVPLYIKANVDDIDSKTDLSRGEREICSDIAGIFADKFDQYIQGCRKEGLKP